MFLELSEKNAELLQLLIKKPEEKFLDWIYCLSSGRMPVVINNSNFLYSNCVMHLFKTFFTTLVIFLGIDFIWLGLIAKNFYDRQLSPFARTLNLPAAFLAYLLIVFGIVFFVLPKASGPSQALLWGALFGLIVYGVYDLVNLATLADWTLKMTVVDMLWGAFVCGTTSLIATRILNSLGPI